MLLIKFSQGVTPLMLASATGQTDMCKVLLENKADPTIKDNKVRSSFLELQHCKGLGFSMVFDVLYKFTWRCSGTDAVLH